LRDPIRLLSARNKLQEENQALRDTLYDAEMMIRYLQLKLLEYGDKEVESLTKHAKRAGREVRRREVQIKVEQALKWKPKVATKTQASRFTLKQRRQSFVNDVAPGKKTFIPSAAATKVASIDLAVASSLVGMKPTNVPRKFERKLQADKIQSPLALRTAQEEKHDETDVGMYEEDKRIKKDNDQMVSVMGKMAEAVITEYSNAEDHMFFLKS
jgi:hypothetical protein